MVLAEQGYTGTTIQQIADAVGLSRAGLLHHFGGKDELFIEIIRRRDDENLAFVTSSGLAPLRVTDVLAMIERNRARPGLTSLYSALIGGATSEGPTSPIRAFAEERYRWALGLISQAIQNDLGWSDTRAQAAGRLLMAMLDGLQIQWLLDPSIDMAALAQEGWASIRDASGAPRHIP